jgi:hypothetical protein
VKLAYVRLTKTAQATDLPRAGASHLGSFVVISSKAVSGPVARCWWYGLFSPDISSGILRARFPHSRAETSWEQQATRRNFAAVGEREPVPKG